MTYPRWYSKWTLLRWIAERIYSVDNWFRRAERDLTHWWLERKEKKAVEKLMREGCKHPFSMLVGRKTLEEPCGCTIEPKRENTGQYFSEVRVPMLCTACGENLLMKWYVTAPEQDEEVLEATDIPVKPDWQINAAQGPLGYGAALYRGRDGAVFTFFQHGVDAGEAVVCEFLLHLMSPETEEYAVGVPDEKGGNHE